MWLINFLHKYFGFNKRERNGILILVSILILLIFIRIFLPETTDSKIEIKKLEKNSVSVDLNSSETDNNKTDSIFNSPTTKQYFPFDPNTLNPEEAKKLGFSNKLFRTLENFRNKGGRFRKKEDLKKLYGMKESHFNELESFIIIASTATDTSHHKPQEKEKNTASIILVDINIADSIQLVSLPGIGPSFAKKILKYRNALGGFFSKEQLKEVYGMHDTTYAKFKDRIIISQKEIEKININTATAENLKKHPYISYQAALTIVNYRTKHGNYKSADDLKEIGSINEDAIEKILPYITFN